MGCCFSSSEYEITDDQHDLLSAALERRIDRFKQILPSQMTEQQALMFVITVYKERQFLDEMRLKDSPAQEGHTTCVCCESNRAAVQMMPCSHLYICHGCYAREKRTERAGKSCFLCRGVVKSTVVVKQI